MRIFFLFTFLTVVNAGFSQARREPNCRTNIYLDVVLDTISWTDDSSSEAGRNDQQPSVVTNRLVRTAIQLSVPNGSFKVISYKITIDLEEDIVEIPVSGNLLNGPAQHYLRIAKPGTFIYFDCINVQHESGALFVAKSFLATR